MYMFSAQEVSGATAILSSNRGSTYIHNLKRMQENLQKEIDELYAERTKSLAEHETRYCSLKKNMQNIALKLREQYTIWLSPSTNVGVEYTKTSYVG